MKEKTLKTKIKDLPTTGNACGFIRQLAGVSAQKYSDAHRARQNEKEGDCINMTINERLLKNQADAVSAFVEKFGEMTVEEYMKEKMAV